MRIKRIEIIGFKSFCDRTVLGINEPITSVVGPNGCGKSNIVDAVRWCMGEQSAKHLRGKAMDDVIFAGSENRGPAGMAEVSLTFEDVGFSHETLELALTQEKDQELAVPKIAGDEGDEGTEVDAEKTEAAAADGDVAKTDAADDETQPEGEAAPEVAAKTDETGETEKVDQAESAKADGEVGEGGVDAEQGEASKEVEKFLADRPAAIDFSSYTEVTVTRRLFRDGTSNYLINRMPCRLRDVTDFFMGTGVGTKAYSIIEQGRIGMIVSARPQDRRTLIEEAAGITKFKAKKKAAERKLDRTKQNLLRVSDIVAELAKRMGSLRRQAQKAERYRRYKTELKDIDLWRASHQYLSIDAETKSATIALAAATEGRDDTRIEFETQDAKVVAERSGLAVEERRLAELQEQLYELENRIKLSENKVEFQTREANELVERVANAQGEIRGLNERQEQAKEQLEQKRGELGSLQSTIDANEQTVEQRDAAAAEARQLLAEAQSGLDKARTGLAQARAELASADTREQALAQRKEESTTRLERVVEDADEGSTKLKTADKEASKAAVKLSELKQTRLDLGVQTESLEKRQAELQERGAEFEAKVETLRTELHRRRSRLQSLIEIHEKYEGFANGTRAVMQNAEGIATSDQKIWGLVADVVQAPAQFELAVEVALGDRLGGILVDSHHVGVKAIEYLKETSAGRSSFVPFKPPTDAAVSGIQVEDRSNSVIGSEGVVGRMVDLIKFDDGFEKVGRQLLNSCVVVETLNRAVELHESGTDETLVTLEGDIVDSRGVVSGGSQEAQGAGVLAQKREIRELEEITTSLATDLADATASVVSTKTELQRVTKTIESLRAEAHNGDIAIMGHDKDLSGFRADADRLRNQLTQLNAEQLELEERLRAVADQEKELAESREQAGTDIERYSAEQEELVTRVESGREQVEELAMAATEAKVRVAQLGEKRASLDAAVLQLELNDRELNDRITKLQVSIAEGTERNTTLRDDTEALQASLVELREKHGGSAAELDEGRKLYEIRVAGMQVAEMAVRELRAKSEEFTGQVNGLEIQLAGLNSQVGVIEDQIAERYNVSLRRIVGDYHLRPLVGEEEEARLEKLKQLIHRMGADINLTAIEEFATVSERHDFLSTQQIDLDNAVDQLRKAIDKINRTSRKKFRDTYNAINGQFQELFPRLFRGGRATLKLTPPSNSTSQDILDFGVDIVAQPPGKKNTTVDQLSGGEKALTAVALIFAIFLIKPSPFCVLDEVDAPLDDANVDRYNEIVREMTDRSQFIVITHNKRTMEIADQLYGVTMQEPGVSKLVSVNLKQIEEYAA